MSRILVLAEHDGKHLNSATLHTLTAAQKLQHEIDIFVVGSGSQAISTSLTQFTQVKKVFVAENTCFDHGIAENIAALLLQYAKNYQFILAPADSFGKNILPRIAAKLDVAMLSDVTHIVAENIFVRPIYAGNAMATMQNDEAIKILTIRATAFGMPTEDANHAEIITLNDNINFAKSQFVKEENTASERPELTSAKIVISGGRALQSAENFDKFIAPLADKLNAAIGASRAAVDAGYVPNDYQVGQTGKIVAPQLYIAIGISGAVQHLAGMKDSKVIVAINKDPEAPIFQVADYGLVADLFTAIPELIEAL